MSSAWETTVDDVINALAKHQVQIDRETAAIHHNNLNHEMVESAALNGDTMDEQVEYAYNEIWHQIQGSIA